MILTINLEQVTFTGSTPNLNNLNYSAVHEYQMTLDGEDITVGTITGNTLIFNSSNLTNDFTSIYDSKILTVRIVSLTMPIYINTFEIYGYDKAMNIRLVDSNEYAYSFVTHIVKPGTKMLFHYNLTNLPAKYNINGTIVDGCNCVSEINKKLAIRGISYLYNDDGELVHTALGGERTFYPHLNEDYLQSNVSHDGGNLTDGKTNLTNNNRLITLLRLPNKSPSLLTYNVNEVETTLIRTIQIHHRVISKFGKLIGDKSITYTLPTDGSLDYNPYSATNTFSFDFSEAGDYIGHTTIKYLDANNTVLKTENKVTDIETTSWHQLQKTSLNVYEIYNWRNVTAEYIVERLDKLNTWKLMNNDVTKLPRWSSDKISLIDDGIYRLKIREEGCQEWDFYIISNYDKVRQELEVIMNDLICNDSACKPCNSNIFSNLAILITTVFSHFVTLNTMFDISKYYKSLTWQESKYLYTLNQSLYKLNKYVNNCSKVNFNTSCQ